MNPTERAEERECNCAECREKWPDPTERPEERRSSFRRGLLVGWAVCWFFTLLAIGFIYHNATVVWHR